MGLLHRKSTNPDLRKDQPPTETQTNAQGEHVSLRKRISSRFHHDKPQQDDTPPHMVSYPQTQPPPLYSQQQFIQQPQQTQPPPLYSQQTLYSSPQQPQQPQLYNMPQYTNQSPQVAMNPYNVYPQQSPQRSVSMYGMAPLQMQETKMPPPPPSRENRGTLPAEAPNVPKPTRQPPPPPARDLRGQLQVTGQDDSQLQAPPKRAPPPRPTRVMSMQIQPQSVQAPQGQYATLRPLPRPAPRQPDIRAQCNCIVEPYRYPFGEFPRDDAETDFAVQRAVEIARMSA